MTTVDTEIAQASKSAYELEGQIKDLKDQQKEVALQYPPYADLEDRITQLKQRRDAIVENMIAKYDQIGQTTMDLNPPKTDDLDGAA